MNQKSQTQNSMIVTNQSPDDRVDLESNPLLLKAYKDGDNDLIYYFKLSPYEAREYKKEKTQEAIEKAVEEFTAKNEELYSHKEFMEELDIEVSHTKLLMNEKYPKVEFDQIYYFDDEAVKFLINEVLKGENYKDAYDTLENKGTEQIKYDINSKLFQTAKKKGLCGEISYRREKAMLSILNNLQGSMINLIIKNRLWKDADKKHYCKGSVNQVLSKLYDVVKRVNQIKATAIEIRQLTKENKQLKKEIEALKLSQSAKSDQWHKLAEDMINPIIHNIVETMKLNRTHGTKKRTGINEIANKINMEQGIPTKTVKSYCLSYIDKRLPSLNFWSYTPITHIKE